MYRSWPRRAGRKSLVKVRSEDDVLGENRSASVSLGPERLISCVLEMI